MIDVQELSFYYGQLHALKQVSFSVLAGELFGFLGPNGAGKTTLIKILTAQLRPSSGRARVAGCDVVKDRQQLKPKIGVVFEQQNLYPRLSARDNLLFSARLYGVPKGRVDDVLEQVGLQDRAKEVIQKYSNGMKQRILIARAILHQPQVLFLDEPTRGLDPGMARSIRSLIRDLAQSGMTVFLTTHYMEEADQLCQRVAILDRGQLVALDSPANLKAAYLAAAPRLGEVLTLEDVFIHLTGHALAE